MRRRFFSLLVILLVAILCPAPARADDPYKFKIGFILSLTGPWAEFGEAQAQAIKLAIEKNPERYAHIEFITEDCGYGGKGAVGAYNKLRTVDNVDLAFVWGVEPALAVAPLAEKHKLPLVVSAVDPSTARGRNFVMRTINYAEQHAITLLKYLRTLGYKKFALIKAQISYYDILAVAIRKNLAPGESLEIIDELLPTDSDFKSIVTKARTKSFDTLGVFLTPPQILSFYKEAQLQNLQVPTFGASPFQSRTLIKQAEGRIEGVLYVHNDVNEDFEKEYVARYGNDIQIPWAANAYDFVVFAGELLGRFDHKPSAEEIMTTLGTARSQIGAGGPYRFVNSPAEGRYFEYPVVVKKIHGDGFQLMYRNTSFQ